MKWLTFWMIALLVAQAGLNVEAGQAPTVSVVELPTNLNVDSDPDPGTPNLTNGQSQDVELAGVGEEEHFKIEVPGDASSLTVEMTGPACGFFGCTFDADLYTRLGSRATDSAYDCRPYTSGSDETCTHNNPAAGWWYVRVHSYAGVGTVTITATHDGTGGGGGNQAPTASFTSSCTDLSCSFDASGSSDPDGDTLTYSWDFGDGGSASGVGPSHTYAAGGTYTVTLTVDDGNGGSDTDTSSVTVTAPGGGGGDCGASDATIEIGNGEAEVLNLPDSGWRHRKICVLPGATTLTVEMEGVDTECGFLCTLDADLYVRQGARPTSSTYDCRPYQSGNEETCTVSTPAAAWWYIGAHAYEGSGTVRITATHDGQAGPTNRAPTASFTHSCTGRACSFDASGSSDPDGDSLTYSWDFGDGASGSGVSPSHTYASGGSYTVTLTVDDGNGGSDTASQTAQPTDPPTGDPYLTSGVAQSGSLSGSGDEDFYRVSVPSGATQLEVVLDGPADSDFDLYTRHGDRPTDSTYDCRPYTSSSDETCTHANPAAGDWYVRVDSYSGGGSYTVTATVATEDPNQAPTASFTFSCTDLSCTFDGAGSSDPDGDSLTYSWDFGDGASSSGVAPSHTYASAGTYTVTLTVDDGNGGSDNDAQSVTVSDAPVENPDWIEWLWPMDGRISSIYWECRSSCARWHRGIDIANGCDTPIYASRAGSVDVRWDADGYGNYVVLSHSDGFLTYYAHMDSVSVSDGQNVAAGQLLGYEGTTGSSTGCHLHFEIRQADNGPSYEVDKQFIEIQESSNYDQITAGTVIGFDMQLYEVSSNANVRDGPGMTDVSGQGNQVLGTAAAGEKYVGYGDWTGPNGRYVNIKWNGQNGWIHHSLLEPVSGTVERVTASTLNVRTGAGTSYSDIGDVHAGQDYYRVGSAQDGGGATWYEIYYDHGGGQTGWIHSGYTDTLTYGTGGGGGGGDSLVGYKIAVDPGHGGSDPGATYAGVEEADINLDVALELRDLLEAEGATVYMTRSTDVAVSLSDRTSGANSWGADYFLSIHANSCGECGGHGTETYYHDSLSASSQAGQLATATQPELITHGGLNDRGVKQANFHVLRETAMPAILVELGFVDHAGDRAVLTDADSQYQFALGMLHGLQEHLGVGGH
ncbi:MAG: PKD domain-containing protein [Thermoplasmatota archaeon]